MRSLLKRLMRDALLRFLDRMEGGLWVLRLAAPIEPARYRSAASGLLRRMLHAELDGLLGASSRALPERR